MARVVVIEKNKDGKIELTKDELQKMLDDAYTQGRLDGNSHWDTITYPSNQWFYSTTTSTSTPPNEITISSDKIHLNDAINTNTAQYKTTT